MVRAPVPASLAQLVAALNAALRAEHDAGHQVAVAVAHVTTPGDARTLSQLHVDVLVPDGVPADVAVYPIARPPLARTA